MGTTLFRRPAAVLLAGLALASGCGRGCTCIEGEKVYEKHDGPVRAELVRSTHWTGGRIPGPISRFIVRVHTDPSFEVPAGCEKVAFAGDENNVAFQCDGEDHWNVIRLRGGARHLVHCNASADDSPDFPALPSIVDSAEDILACSMSGDTFTELVRSIEEDAGAERASAFVLKHAGDEIRAGDDYWSRGLETLSDDARSKTREKLCEALVDPKAPRAAFVRAAERCALDVKGAGEAALTRLRARLATDRANEAYGSSDRELWWSATIAVGRRPEEAGSLACDLVDKAEPNELYGQRGAAIGTILAHTDTPCPAIVKLANSASLCGGDTLCGDYPKHLCTRDELERERTLLNDVFESKVEDDGKRRLGTTNKASAVLAAFYLLDELPPKLIRRDERRTYKVVEPDKTTEKLPHCSRQLPNGSPCSCDRHQIESAVCSTDADEPRALYLTCDIAFDDEAKTVSITNRCGEEGDACGIAICCSEYDCSGPPDSVCKPKEKPDAAAP